MTEPLSDILLDVWLSGSVTSYQWGFVINPYDWCVANQVIDGKQCTILWHVDDLEISHVNENTVTDIIEKITSEFGKGGTPHGHKRKNS